MNTRETRLGKAERLALAVAAGQPVAAAARELRIARRTVYGWSARPAFKRRVAALRARMVDQAVGRLSETVTQAAGTLAELLGAGHPANVRLQAARAVLAELLALKGQVEFEARLAALERLASESKRSGP